MTLPFFVGAISSLKNCGIETAPLRKSNDGTLAIVHMHALTIEQFENVRTKTSIEALSYEQAQSLMQTADWSRDAA